ncbi:MAG: SAM-dependent methyltransferase, FkbM family, partial [Acidobacteria bacterium]|nr:SAM-dependent methyltransferase, FkbM family [Acidobacteriota bacterium]
RAAKPFIMNNNPNSAIQQMWADAIFIRDPFHLEALSSEQLLKLGIFLALYGSPDLAHFLLKEHDRREGTNLGEPYLQALFNSVIHEDKKPMPSKTVLTFAEGVRIAVPDSLDLITTFVILEQQDWFEDEIKFLRRLLRAGDKAIDIGANYGVYTLSMAKTVGASGCVWAFEPASTTARYLTDSIAINGFSNVYLEQSALSNACGSGNLSLNTNSELNALIQNPKQSEASEVVKLVTLDVCMEKYKWQNIEFMKIDAEGEESNIIEGGRRFFDVLSPLVQFEIKAGADLHMELVDKFSEIGYDSYRLVPGLDLLVPFDAHAVPDGYLLNLFCCKPDRAEHLATQGFLLTMATHSLGGDPGEILKNEEALAISDNYGWRKTLVGLPYGVQLAESWERAVAPGKCIDLEKGLALYWMSRDTALSKAVRFESLERSFRLLKSLCEREPSFACLVSQVRVARDFGERSCAVASLKGLIDLVFRKNRLEQDQPFLAPSDRFDLLPPGPSIDSWVRAAILEEFERLGAFSSFYSGASSLSRLEQIHSLGFGSAEMERRLSLLRQHLGMSNQGEEAKQRGNIMQPFPPIVELTKSRFGNMLFPSKDPYVGNSLRKYGQFNQGEFELFTQFISGGCVVLDVGANIGFHTVPLAQLVGSEGVVVAFEPQPVLHKILSANLVLNNIPNVLTYSLALGNCEGECLIPLPDYFQSDPSGGPSLGEAGDGETIPLGKLDDFALDRVDFIRLDVGGFESQILEGATETIERCRPILYVRNDSVEHSAELIQRLFDMGYRLWWHTPPLFSPDNFKGNQENVFPGIVSINMLAIHRDMRPIEGLMPILSVSDTWQ